MRPALAAVLDGVQAAVQAGGERGRADRGDVLGRQRAAGELGRDLAGDELLVDEAPRALDDEVLVRLGGDGGGQRGFLGP